MVYRRLFRVGFGAATLLALGLAVVSPVGAQSFFTGKAPEVMIADPRTNETLKEVGFDQRLDAAVPIDLPFKDEDGRTVTLREVAAGKPLILVPAYYRCPMLCTFILAGTANALRAVTLTPGEDFAVAIVSFDPAETPEIAAEAKKRFFGATPLGLSSSVRLLTGTNESIQPVMEAIGFRYLWDAPREQWAHAAGIVLVTPEGRAARYFYGVEYPPRDLRLGLVETGRGSIGSPVDHLLLYCFKYDPATGKYTAAVLNLLRLAAAGTIVVIGLYFLLHWRRGKLQTNLGKA